MYCVDIMELIRTFRYVLSYNTCKNRLNTNYNTYHNKYQIHCTRMSIYCNTLVFGMYEIMIRANTGQVQAFFSMRANTDATTFTNTSPIESNTDLYKLKYRPIQAPIQTNTHIILFNTCNSTCQYSHW